MGIDWGQVLNVAGHASRGVLEGQRDIQDREQYEYLKKKREYDLEQMALEKKTEEEARGALPEGDYSIEDRSKMGLNEVGPSPATKWVSRKPADVEKDRIAALSRGTAAQQGRATALQTAMQGREQFEYMMHQQRVHDTFLQANQIVDTDPLAAVSLLAKASEGLPGGTRYVVHQNENGQWVHGFNQGGRWLKPPEPLTVASAKAAVVNSLKFASIPAFQAITTAQNQEMTAQAARQQAATGQMKAEFEVGPKGAAEIKFMQQHGGELESMGQYYANRLNVEKETPSQAAMKKIEGLSTIIQQANPGMTKEAADLQAARWFTHDPNLKEPSDNLANSDLIKINGKYFRDTKKGLVPVEIPGTQKSLAERFVDAKREGATGTETPTAPAQGIKPPEKPTAKPAAAPGEPKQTKPLPAGAKTEAEKKEKQADILQKELADEQKKYTALQAKIKKTKDPDYLKELQDQLVTSQKSITGIRKELERFFPKGTPVPVVPTGAPPDLTPAPLPPIPAEMQYAPSGAPIPGAPTYNPQAQVPQENKPWKLTRDTFMSTISGQPRGIYNE